ncbi:peptidase M10 [Lactobacillus nasalidis]|uniref:Peptidase M10 n=1 Tax=Lactobacillus nasalidis TaxID=2797258 RepID=A0ABQ3W3F7_9LACO|nr:matrixin family metalloprotease [Lactobacillus nasalidis]GHV97696.1 peptidase M10 [Lactobacillus nasalidis]GHV99472.1 peptidase M10 [Lactobacillus nasalidis]GHW00935.1 peptidase M10 [Lactobacillus nasalidis]
MRRFLNFIKNLLILAVMAGVLVNYHEQIQTFLLEAAGTANTYLEQKGLKSKTLDLSSAIVTESKTTAAKNTTGYRWPKATAKVYIAVKQTDLYNATVNAMAAWNQTGAFTFKQTKQKKNAQIVVVTDSKNNGAAGLTTYKYLSHSNRLYSAQVALNTYYLESNYYNYTQARIVNTVEHELGHAIGLDHRSGVSVMYPTGSIYTIQPKDIALVKKIYKSKS